MKSILSLAVLAVFVCGLAAASGGGFSLEDELKRPEAQKAINEYITQHCQFNLWPDEFKQWQSSGIYVPAPIHAQCSVDAK
jgi:hypothetical protein